MSKSRTIGDLLGQDRKLLTIAPETPAAEVAIFMKANRIGSLLVTDASGRLAGILSERDLVCKVMAVGEDPTRVTAGALMTRDVLTCTPDTSVQDAERTMAHNRIRHLPVVRNGKPVGMISMRDVLADRLRTYRTIVSSQSAFLERLESSHPGITQLQRDKAGRIVI